MNQKPVLMFYCQHSLGMGHLIRSLTLAEALAGRFELIFLNGGRFPDHTSPPSEVIVINLPPLGMDEQNQLYSQDERYSLKAAQDVRRQMILEVFDKYTPDALLIELFPFGRKKFAYELLPLLKAARKTATKKIQVFCSLRDIMVSARKDQLRHDNRARWLVDRYFDGVLVHSDPKFARLEESFKPSKPLKVPVNYTGFVLPSDKALHHQDRQRKLVVSVGGGMVGGPLLKLAVQAQTVLWSKLKLSTTIVAGPFLPENEWQELKSQAKDCLGLTLLRNVPTMTDLLNSHSISVSQCGYNTVMDILKSGIAALVVPYSVGQENEQANRAERLQKLGLLRVETAENLDLDRFVTEIEQLFLFIPNQVGLELGGAVRSAEQIYNQVVVNMLAPVSNAYNVKQAAHV